MTHKSPCISHLADCDTLLALAERVEALDGECRKTDGDIAEALGIKPERFVNADGNGRFSDDGIGRRKYRWIAPLYTGSRDAAASLMPEGWRVDEIMWPRKMFNHGILCHLYNSGNFSDSAGQAKTEPNARTAAALRAIHAEMLE